VKHASRGEDMWDFEITSEARLLRERTRMYRPAVGDELFNWFRGVFGQYSNL
jgi:hypothetical protein